MARLRDATMVDTGFCKKRHSLKKPIRSIFQTDYWTFQSNLSKSLLNSYNVDWFLNHPPKKNTYKYPRILYFFLFFSLLLFPFWHIRIWLEMYTNPINQYQNQSYSYDNNNNNTMPTSSYSSMLRHPQLQSDYRAGSNPNKSLSEFGM